MHMVCLVSLYRNWISQMNLIQSVKSPKITWKWYNSSSCWWIKHRGIINCSSTEFWRHVFFMTFILMHDDDITSVYTQITTLIRNETFPWGNKSCTLWSLPSWMCYCDTFKQPVTRLFKLHICLCLLLLPSLLDSFHQSFRAKINLKVEMNHLITYECAESTQ